MLDDNKVAVLLEGLQAQFRTFGEGLQVLDEKVDQGFSSLNTRMDRIENRMDKMENRMDKMESQMENLKSSNHQEHRQLMQMICELDQQVQVELKRVK